MEQQIDLKSYAKINLYLEVTGRRPDGYHDIRTIFQTIDLHDIISLKLIPSGIKLECDGSSIPLNEGNIAYKAARLLLAKSKITGQGLSIHIKKNIPVTAGLAGGSSNAAAVLCAGSKLLGMKLSHEELQELALSLGSDVPFMLKGGTQIATGRGEVLRQLPPLKEMHLVLVVEGIKPSTGKVYSEFKKSLTKAGAFVKKLEAFKNGGEPEQILYNDLEEPAIRLEPKIKEVKKEMLLAGAKAVLMSGGGPTVFGIARNAADAESIAKKLKEKYSRVIISKTITPAV